MPSEHHDRSFNRHERQVCSGCGWDRPSVAIFLRPLLLLLLLLVVVVVVVVVVVAVEAAAVVVIMFM